MTTEGWLIVIRKAQTDSKLANMLADYLAQIDASRSALQRKGYGVTGMSIERQVEEVPSMESLS